jgi:DNA-directed RNA polymerase subunit RPC12/RpoP
MVNYTCPTCNKEFKQKRHFIEHTQFKKKPCKQILPILTKNDQNLPIFTESDQKTQCNNCEHCGKSFVTIYTLNRHLNGRCKVKKSSDEENQKQIIQFEELKKLLVEQSQQIREQSKQIEELKKQKKPSSVYTHYIL